MVSTQFKKGMTPWNKGKQTNVKPWNYGTKKVKICVGCSKEYTGQGKFFCSRECQWNNKEWRYYPNLRYNINNGITLCKFHHPKKRMEENKLRTFFINILGMNK